MKARHKRFFWIAMGLAVIAVAAALVLRSFNSNLVFFFTPSEVAQKKAPQDRTFRIGGLVTAGSVKRNPDGLTVTEPTPQTLSVGTAHAVVSTP